MRSGKGFMEINVKHVDTEVAGRVIPIIAFRFAPSM
jgi:hypothetical protein